MTDFSAPAVPAPRPTFRRRLDATMTDLTHTAAALARRPHPDERAILAGALLGAAGHLLRRGKALTSEQQSAADDALEGLQREDIALWLGGATATGLRQTLQRAADAAFEVGLSDDDGEREDHRNAALEGLAEREHMAALLQASRRWESIHGALDERHRRRRDALEAEINAVDSALRKTAVALVHLNDDRRSERDLLDDEARSSAWWYGLHADDDRLGAVFTSQKMPAGAAGRPALALVQTPPRRHLSEDDLWAYDLGLLGDEQRSWVNRHTSSCHECKRALRALQEGESAIHEALGVAPSKPALAPELEQEAAFEHAHFRAFVTRTSKKARLFVEEKTPGALAALTPVTAHLKPRRLRGGFELQIQLASTQATSLKLRATLARGDDVTFEIPLR